MRLFFSTACEFPRGTWRAPAPTPPPCLPGAAGSSGHGLGGPRCTPGQSGALPPRSSSLVGCPGRGSSSKARFSPPSRYRRLVRHTVPADVSSASTMRITPQPVSAFSRIRARATFRAGLFPPRISRSNWSRSSPFQPDHIPFSSHGCHPPTSTLLKKGSNLRRFLKQLPKPS